MPDAPPQEFTVTESNFDIFRPIREDELHQVISTSNKKSFQLEPLPPFIIITILDDIHF